MTSKRYRWQREWSTDLRERCTRHSSGIAFVWSRERGTAPAAVSSVNGREWFGAIPGGSASVDEWFREQPNIRDPHSRRSRMQRACREAAEVWAWTLARSERTLTDCEVSA